MSYTRNRIGAIRAGQPMQAPGTSSGGDYGMGPTSVSVGGAVEGNASVQTTGILLIVLVVLVIVGERMGR